MGIAAKGGGVRGFGATGQLEPEGIEKVEVKALQRDLRKALRGEVRFDAGSRAIYSHDSSNYRQHPLGVVIPETTDEIAAAVAICHGIRPRSCRAAVRRASPGRPRIVRS